MTRDEAKKLVMIIKASFPNWHPDDLSFTVDAWAAMLRDYDYRDAETALRIYISTDTSGFAPAIGQIIQKMHIADDYTELTEMQAWDLVSKALRNGCYGAEKEFLKLPEAVQQAVGSPSQLHNWATMEGDGVETVIQSHFARSYRAILNRRKEFKRMPQDVKALIAKTKAALEDKQGGDER